MELLSGFFQNQKKLFEMVLNGPKQVCNTLKTLHFSSFQQVLKLGLKNIIMGGPTRFAINVHGPHCFVP